jgi:hypothetical protein
MGSTEKSKGKNGRASREKQVPRCARNDNFLKEIV